MPKSLKKAISILSEKDASPHKSMFGGDPFVNEDFSWPSHDGVPLNFMVQLDLSDIQATLPLDYLPSKGFLLFFYDNDRQPWGNFDDNGSWRVIYQDNPVKNVSAPNTVYIPGELRNSGMSFELIDTYPDPDIINLNEEEVETYFKDFYSKNEGHTLGGYSYDIQGSSKEDAFMIQHRYYYEREFTDAQKEEYEDYVLLFQLDSDQNINFIVGDMGTLYFYGDVDEMRDGNFENIWLTSQCA